LSRFRMVVIAAILAALASVYPATAQTVASLKIISGDGQVVCLCESSTLQFFQPLIVQALDSGGHGIANSTITWTVTSGGATVGAAPGTISTTSVTDANGFANVSVNEIEIVLFGTATRAFVQSTITATATGGAAANFIENYALLDNTANSLVKSGGPLMNGVPLGQVTLSGNSGSSFAPIQLFVGAGTSNTTVTGASVELILPPGQTSPTIKCAPSSSTGNPNTVLSGALLGGSTLLNASCTPVIAGSGTGQFYVIIGGVTTPTPGLAGGVVSTNGTAVTFASGSTDFTSVTVGQQILINGSEYLVAATNSSTSLTLATSAGVQTNVPWLPFQPLFLQEFGPYTFTSVPGAPAAVKLIQGDKQLLAPAQSLGTLVAQVVDSVGNAVQNVNVTWSPNPAGAVALTNTTTVTDNSGFVSTAASLSGAAAGNINITVAVTNNTSIANTFVETAVVPIKSLAKISGDLQTATVGTTFALPIVVQVNGNSLPLTNYPVQFSVSGPATLSQNSANTNNSGQAQVTVFAGSTAGTATVTASVGGLSQTFTLTVKAAGPTPTGITIVSGNTQNAVINTNFPAPLVVQVNSASGPVSNFTVQFSTAGPVSISSSSAVTNSAGQASVTASAASTTGGASVTASIAGGFTATFNLTVNPKGPSITLNSFANAGSGQTGVVSPCSLATITADGLAPNGAASLFPAPVFGPLPLSANGISVNFANFFAPIFSATMVNGVPQLLVQVPCEVPVSNNTLVTVNIGAGSTSVNVPVAAVSPGIFTIPYSDGAVRAVALRSDGSFVTLNPFNPARRGEILRVYVTGLGPTTPPVGTGQVDNPGADLIGADALALGRVVVGISGASGVTVTSARLGANMIGVFEVAFIVPTDAPQGNDIGISVGIVPVGGTNVVNSLATKIPIQ
jgi:uncharacterized protein (TIGR03437 family)